jgi:hypothetical protein
MPAALGANLDLYRRYDLDGRVSMVGIDYPGRTVNVYFLGAPARCRQPESVRALLGECGLPGPSEQMLALAQRSTGFYTTLSWDSPAIQRITYAVIVPDLRALPDTVDVEPGIEKFVRSVPHTYDADPKGIYGVTAYAGGEYYKLQTYYQLSAGSAEARGLLGPSALEAP